MKISSKAKSINPSQTRKLFDKAKKYNNVIDFTLGDPDFHTPESIKNAACCAIMKGKTKYSANAGLINLREVISKRILLENGVQYDPNSEIMVTVGAMEALYLTFLCIIDSGDEVIIPSPYWINYEHMVRMCDGCPIIVDSDYSNNFVVSIEKIISSITDKTVAIIINSPSNPTGSIYDKETIKKLCDIAMEKNLIIVWDECYKNIIYDEERYCSILDFPQMKDHSIIINSCSKTFSMTGWRIGYIAAPKELIANTTKLQENIAACASLPAQYAAIEAFRSDYDIIKSMVDGFKERRDYFVSEINKIEKLSCKLPQATFYVLVDIRKTGLNSEDFAYQLLDKKHVAVVPGITYGECCEGFIRIAYTMDLSKIKIGIERIKEFVNEL